MSALTTLPLLDIYGFSSVICPAMQKAREKVGVTYIQKAHEIIREKGSLSTHVCHKVTNQIVSRAFAKFKKEIEAECANYLDADKYDASEICRDMIDALYNWNRRHYFESELAEKIEKILKTSVTGSDSKNDQVPDHV